MDWSEASYFGLNSCEHPELRRGSSSPPRNRRSMLLSLTPPPASERVLAVQLQQFYRRRRLPDAARHLRVGLDVKSQPPASAQAEGDLLTNLVCYSHAGGSLALPTGYVPLPDNLYNSARTEISDAFPNAEKTCNGPTPPLSSGPGSSKGSGHSKGSGSSSGSGAGPGAGPGAGSGSKSYSGTSSGLGRVVTNIRQHLGISVATTAPPVTRSAGTSHTKVPTTPQVTTPQPAPSKGGRGFEPTIVALAEGTERFDPRRPGGSRTSRADSGSACRPGSASPPQTPTSAFESVTGTMTANVMKTPCKPCGTGRAR